MEQQFLSLWQDSCAAFGGHATPDLLRGLVLIEEGVENKLRYIDPDMLPSSPPLRFKALFAIKPRMTLEEITPFIDDLVEPGSTASKLLLKHARLCDEGGVRTYAAK